MNSSFNKIISNITEKNIYSQAYIITCDDKALMEKAALKLSKVLVCPHKYCDNCTKCNICKRIENNNFSELKIINSEGKEIKKEMIIDIRNSFQTNSIEGKNQVYVISDAELLNQASANSILKFIEEPDSNTVAIFTTTNLGKILSTIKSRCQIIRIDTEKKTDYNSLLKYYDITPQEAVELKNIYERIELRQVDIINYKEGIIKKYIEKEEFKKLLRYGLIFYKCYLEAKISTNDKILEINKEIIDGINKDKIIKKIGLILENLEKIEYNVNMSLFIMNYFIEMGEIKND